MRLLWNALTCSVMTFGDKPDTRRREDHVYAEAEFSARRGRMMNEGRPTVRSRQVANELKRLRKAAGLTAGEVGARLGVSQSKISRIENGNLGLKLEEVAAMLGLYHVGAERREELLDLVREAGKAGWVHMHRVGLPEQWQVLIDWEGKASALRNYQTMIIPGLVQTPDYARAIIAGTTERELGTSEMDTRVAARLGRQAILSRPLPPELHLVLHEAALHIPVGEPGVLVAQLRHLIEMAHRPRVTVQVVPFAAGPHPGLESAFVLMDFAADPPLVHLENRAMSVFLEEPPQIAAYQLAWDRMLAKALPPKRSTDLLTRIARELAAGP